MTIAKIKMPDRRQFLLGAGGSAALMGVPEMVFANTRSHGFYVPDEAKPHERTFMQWPVSKRVYRDRYFLELLQNAIADVANTIAEFEPVVMLMDKSHEAKARNLLSRKIEIWDVPTEDLWCRDSGPLFMTNAVGDLAISHLNFNGWGNKQIHKNDGIIARRISEILDLPFYDNGLVGEPGGVETNGHGTLIAHESSWVNRNRNMQSKATITSMLLEAYGADKVIWAPGVAGADITDYHIDALARFVATDEVLIQLPEDIIAGDPWSKAAFETHDIIQNSMTADGREIKITVIDEPRRPRVKSMDFVASYVNYYICNGAIISAQFGDEETDAQATGVLSKAYPNREIVSLNVDPIGEMGGGIHCATQQQPKINA